MEMRDMNRSAWKSIRKKKQITENFENRGKISLLKILEISEPFQKRSGEEMITLADRNYTWLQIALEADYVWYTAMFDENDRFLQLYADLTDGNHTDCENPYFQDMYLDYVITRQEIRELDRQELENAYAQGCIDRTQYMRTMEYGEKLKAFFRKDCAGIIEKLCTYQQTLKMHLEDNGG